MKSNQTYKKIIGILGGMGPQATMDFEQRVHAIAKKLHPPKFSTGYPTMISYYFREVPIAMNEDGSFISPPQPNPDLLEAARKIGTISDFIVITSNTPHFFQKQIEEISGKKVLSMIDATVEEIKKRKDKKIGLMAIGFSLKNRLFQNKLDPFGLEYEVMPDEMAQRLDQSIEAVMENEPITKELTKPAKEALAYLRSKDVDSIILGCTEIPFLLEDELDTPDIVNPIQLLAQFTVRYSL